jgi:hypothetical protein
MRTRTALALLLALVVVVAASVAAWFLTREAKSVGTGGTGGAGGTADPPVPKIDPVEAEKLTALVAEPMDDEFNAASGVEAISLFAGILALEKDATRGIGASIVQGLVHDAALTAFTSFPGKVGAALAPLAILEMTYQCSTLGGDDRSGCASSSVFLAVQVGMRWRGEVSGAAKWFTEAFSNVKGAFQGMKGVRVKPNPAGLGRALGQLVREFRWVRLVASVAKDAAAKEAAAALALRMTAASTKIAASIVPKSGGALQAAGTALAKAVPQVARQIAARIGAHAATVAVSTGARVGASIAAGLGARAVAFFGGPVAVAVMVIQLTLGIAMAVADAHCVGDLASHCHATKATLDRLTGPEGGLRELFQLMVAHRYGTIAEGGQRSVDGVRSMTEMQPRSLERERVDLWRMAMRGTVYRDALLREPYTFTGYDTVALWVEHLAGIDEPKMQFLEIYLVMQNLASVAELSLEIMVEHGLCTRESPAYRFDDKATWPAPSCRASRGRCCARAKAVHAAMGVAHAAGSTGAKSNATGACAAFKLAVYLQHDPGLVVDVFEALEALGVTAENRAKPATWAAWRNQKGTGGMQAYLNTIPIVIDGTRRMYPEQLLRVACTIAIVDVLGGSAVVSSGTEAVALFGRYIVEGAKLVYPSETVVDADIKHYMPDAAFFGAWPTHKDGDRAWLHNDPELMLLSVRWIPDKEGGPGMSLDEACDAATPGLEEGQCVPDFAQYSHTHACRYIKSGEATNTADDPRTYEDDGDRKTHIVNWATGRCTPDTAYCEEYAMHPEPEDASAACTSDEDAALKAATTTYLIGLLAGFSTANPLAVCNFPAQCPTKRQHCHGNVCTCSKPIEQQVLSAVGLAETGAGGLNRFCALVKEKLGFTGWSLSSFV